MPVQEGTAVTTHVDPLRCKDSVFGYKCGTEFDPSRPPFDAHPYTQLAGCAQAGRYAAIWYNGTFQSKDSDSFSLFDAEPAISHSLIVCSAACLELIIKTRREHGEEEHPCSRAPDAVIDGDGALQLDAMRPLRKYRGENSIVEFLVVELARKQASGTYEKAVRHLWQRNKHVFVF